MSTPLPFAPMLSIPVLPRGPKPVGIDDITMGSDVDTFGALFAMFATQISSVTPNPILGEATVNLPGMLTTTDDPAKAGATAQQSTQSQPTILPHDPLGLIAMADKMTRRDTAPDGNTEQFAQTTKSGIPVSALIEASTVMPEATTITLGGQRPSTPFPGEGVTHNKEQSQATPTVTVQHDEIFADQVVPRVAVAVPERWSNLARNLNVLNIDVTTSLTPTEMNTLSSADTYKTPIVPTSPVPQPVSSPALVIEQVAAENRVALRGTRREVTERKPENLSGKAIAAKQTSDETLLSTKRETTSGMPSDANSVSYPEQKGIRPLEATVANERSETKPEALVADTSASRAKQETTNTETMPIALETKGNSNVAGLEQIESDQQPQHVRFTLPEKLPVPNNGRSHTVTISLEPEHLGPARLHLSSHNDLVSARLTVDTPEAKAVVDGSLDRLVEQLHKAGVRVQQVDVQVRGDLLPGHSQHQQTSWRRGFAGRSRTLSPLAAAESVAARPLSMLLTPSVMTAGQLNLYA